MSNNLYMPLHPADYLTDTAHLSAAEHGAYLLLIMNYWQKGEPLPADDRKLRMIARMTADEWAESRDLVLEFFDECEGVLHHKRIDAELERAREKSSSARASAKRSHSVRKAPAKPTQSERPANQDQVQEQKEDASASSLRELADFKQGVMQAFQAAGSMAFPDTHRTAIWLERGWKPQICLAVIAEVLARNNTITSLKYFDQPIADAHQKPEGKGLAPSGYKSPIVDMKAGAVAVVEGTEAYSAWLSKSPAVLKHKRREEKVDGVTRWVAYLPTEYPPGHVPKLSLSDRKEDAA